MTNEVKTAINRYVSHNEHPGSFIVSILQNDLKKTMLYADDQSIKDLREIYLYIYNSLSGICWGSKEIVEKWLTQEREK